MRSRVSVWLLSLLVSVFLIAFSGVSIDVSAALSGGRYMTPQEALDVFGSEISFTYYDGTDYTESSFLYNTTVSMGTTAGDLPDNWSDYTSATYLEYVATVQSPVPVANPNYITVNILPTYSIFDTEQITSLIALSSMTSSVSTVYQSPSWDWIIGGTTYHYENDLDDGNGLYSSIQFRQHFQSTFVPMQFIGSASTSGYSYRAQFSGNVVGGSSVASAYRYKYYLHLMCPYISSSASGSFGTVTTSSGSSGGDTNINVNVDMDETNGLLRGIPAAIAGIFIPSDDDLQSWLDDMEGVFHDTFGQYSEVDSVLDDMEDLLYDTSPSAVVELPAVSIPNTHITLESRRVDLVRPEFSGILDIIKWAFDIAATCLFVNTMKRKVDEVILGKIVVESESDD